MRTESHLSDPISSRVKDGRCHATPELDRILPSDLGASERIRQDELLALLERVRAEEEDHLARLYTLLGRLTGDQPGPVGRIDSGLGLSAGGEVPERREGAGRRPQGGVCRVSDGG
jgi:hypothetical protein